MPINKQSYRILGMKQDSLIGTNSSIQYALDIHNLRFTTLNDYTTAVWTNEKSTKQEVINCSDDTRLPEDLKPIGQAIIDEQWILFCISRDTNPNYIIQLWYDNDILNGKVLYKGNLNFNVNNPIETISYYESKTIRKVYWTDGINQPRMINIDRVISSNADTQFDFIQEVDLIEAVSINKIPCGGLFSSGTIKYAISYYNKYGQESNIVYDSPLFYTILGSRGLNPDGKELSSDSFEIEITNIDTHKNFDYIRIYSIQRAVEGTTPICKIVTDIPLTDKVLQDNKVSFIDTNTTGEIIDPTILYYLGGQEILAETMNQKDNTLFLGNLTLKKNIIPNEIKNQLFNSKTSLFSSDDRKNIVINGNNVSNEYYRYLNQLNTFYDNSNRNNIVTFNGNSHNIKYFKYQETYRFGIQFQDNKGVWSEVIHIGDIENNVLPIIGKYGNIDTFKPALYKYQIPFNTARSLKALGYRKARLCCVYPTNADRNIICQGVVNPTVYSKKWRESNTPYAMASWFFRADNSNNIAYEGALGGYETQGYDLNTNENINNANPRYNNKYPEIQCMRGDNSNNDSIFKVDRKIVTLNSPEIDFNETFRSLDKNEFKFRIIGKIPINSSYGTTYLEVNNIATTYRGLSVGKYIDINNNKTLFDSQSDNISYSGIWKDISVYDSSADSERLSYLYNIYPFQRKGCLNDYMKDVSEWRVRKDKENINHIDINITESSVLESKCLANIRYSTFTEFDNNVTNKLISNIELVDTDEVIPYMLGSNVYYGNVNSIAPVEDIVSLDKYTYTYKRWNIDANNTWSNGSNRESEQFYGKYPLFMHQKWVKQLNPSDTILTYVCGTSSDPVPITYKSTPHYVINLNIDIPVSQTNYEYLYLGEIYRDNVTNKFGGNDEIALLNNNWIPCSDTYDLRKTPINDNTLRPNEELPILFATEGDYYYQRYDCLKTYPYDLHDVNQIVEILSFMCETRINIDGRYDKRRGWLDNTTTNPSNFNLINTGYTQNNTFFIQKSIDKWIQNITKFPNQFTWTKTKSNGDSIDTWTNITLASTADADGTVGSITKIEDVQNKLILFQDKGIASIDFNEKTALSVDNGVPLEIANSGKYTGLTYLTKDYGCQNKWSISNTKNGIFFIDNYRKQLLSTDGKSISTLQEFDSFMINNIPNTFGWKPYNMNDFVTYYDNISKDIYYINKDHCLAFNEDTNTFTSFYDYNNVPFLANISNHSLVWNNGVWTLREGTDYNNFFGKYKPYWITLVADGANPEGNAFSVDKVFNNIEYRADTFNEFGIPRVDVNIPVFTHKAAWNDYQFYKQHPINAVRKFNIWRVQLPRANYNNSYTRDRIRNPWTYIQLYKESNDSNNRMILHDFIVSFDMK